MCTHAADPSLVSTFHPNADPRSLCSCSFAHCLHLAPFPAELGPWRCRRSGFIGYGRLCSPHCGDCSRGSHSCCSHLKAVPRQKTSHLIPRHLGRGRTSLQRLQWAISRLLVHLPAPSDESVGINALRSPMLLGGVVGRPFLPRVGWRPYTGRPLCTCVLLAVGANVSLWAG